jgi:hypothetical protein
MVIIEDVLNPFKQTCHWRTSMMFCQLLTGSRLV